MSCETYLMKMYNVEQIGHDLVFSSNNIYNV